MNAFWYAVAFLTRVPVRRHPPHAGARASSVPWFPIVGALVGALVAVVYAALAPILPHLVAATVAVTAGIAITGAFHEDGLADAIDGLAGGRDPESRLRIMKDSRQGTFGVLALIAVFVLRVSCVGSLDAWAALAALVAAHTLGRAAALVLMRAPAGGTGLAATYTASTGARHVLLGSFAGVVVAVVAAGPFALVAGAGGLVGVLVVGQWSRRATGAVTGDVLGAAEQIAEMVVLVALTGWSAGGHALAWYR